MTPSAPGTTSAAAVSAPTAARAVDPAACRSPLGTFAECPHCGSGMAPEHAHFRCTGCGWRDSCCD